MVITAANFKVNKKFARSSYLPSIDGLRALSIILVLGQHCRSTSAFPSGLDALFGWIFDGNLGVRFFFVISGFLITWGMILEFDRGGTVNLGHFYVRRALRILPVYFAFIIVLLGLQLVTPFKQEVATWVGNLTFTTNFGRMDSWPSEHLWSLSVEEQFYFVWPLIFAYCVRRNDTNLIIYLSMVPVVIAPICRALWVALSSDKHHPVFLTRYWPDISQILKPFFPYYSFFNFWDSLAVGCICAILFARERAVIEHFLYEKAATAAMFGLALILLPHIMTRMSILRSCVWLVGFTIQAVGFGILLLQSVALPDWKWYRILNWRWVRRVGVLSFSIYIWQQIFSTKPDRFGLGPVWWMSFPGWLIPVLVVGFCSYYGLERPLMKLRSRLREL